MAYQYSNQRSNSKAQGIQNILLSIDSLIGTLDGMKAAKQQAIEYRNNMQLTYDMGRATDLMADFSHAKAMQNPILMGVAYDQYYDFIDELSPTSKGRSNAFAQTFELMSNTMQLPTFNVEKQEKGEEGIQAAKVSALDIYRPFKNGRAAYGEGFETGTNGFVPQETVSSWLSNIDENDAKFVMSYMGLNGKMVPATQVDEAQRNQYVGKDDIITPQRFEMIKGQAEAAKNMVLQRSYKAYKNHLKDIGRFDENDEAKNRASWAEFQHKAETGEMLTTHEYNTVYNMFSKVSKIAPELSQADAVALTDIGLSKGGPDVLNIATSLFVSTNAKMKQGDAEDDEFTKMKEESYSDIVQYTNRIGKTIVGIQEANPGLVIPPSTFVKMYERKIEEDGKVAGGVENMIATSTFALNQMVDLKKNGANGADLILYQDRLKDYTDNGTSPEDAITWSTGEVRRNVEDRKETLVLRDATIKEHNLTDMQYDNVQNAITKFTKEKNIPLTNSQNALIVQMTYRASVPVYNPTTDKYEARLDIADGLDEDEMDPIVRAVTASHSIEQTYKPLLDKVNDLASRINTERNESQSYQQKDPLTSLPLNREQRIEANRMAVDRVALDTPGPGGANWAEGEGSGRTQIDLNYRNSYDKKNVTGEFNVPNLSYAQQEIQKKDYYALYADLKNLEEKHPGSLLELRNVIATNPNAKAYKMLIDFAENTNEGSYYEMVRDVELYRSKLAEADAFITSKEGKAAPTSDNSELKAKYQKAIADRPLYREHIKRLQGRIKRGLEVGLFDGPSDYIQYEPDGTKNADYVPTDSPAAAKSKPVSDVAPIIKNPSKPLVERTFTEQQHEVIKSAALGDVNVEISEVQDAVRSYDNIKNVLSNPSSPEYILMNALSAKYRFDDKVISNDKVVAHRIKQEGIDSFGYTVDDSRKKILSDAGLIKETITKNGTTGYILTEKGKSVVDETVNTYANYMKLKRSISQEASDIVEGTSFANELIENPDKKPDTNQSVGQWIGSYGSENKRYMYIYDEKGHEYKFRSIWQVFKNPILLADSEEDAPTNKSSKLPFVPLEIVNTNPVSPEVSTPTTVQESIPAKTPSVIPASSGTPLDGGEMISDSGKDTVTSGKDTVTLEDLEALLASYEYEQKLKDKK